MCGRRNLSLDKRSIPYFAFAPPIVKLGWSSIKRGLATDVGQAKDFRCLRAHMCCARARVPVRAMRDDFVNE